MLRKKAETLVFDSQLAAETQSALEQTVRELQECLTRFDSLHQSFRRQFLQLFTPEKSVAAADGPGEQVPSALSNAYFFTQANLAGQALSHLEYAVDLADMACGLTALAARPAQVKRKGSPR